MGGAPSMWNDQRIETLITMAGAGASAGEIALAISGRDARFSRSAVLGKAHRLRLPLTGKPTRPKREPKPAKPLPPPADPGAPAKRGRPRKYVSGPPATPATRREPLVFDSATPPPKPLSLQLRCEQLTDHTCKWPYKHPAMSASGSAVNPPTAGLVTASTTPAER
jgi:hypothetical protein